MTQQQNETDDDARKRERGREERETKGRGKNGEGGERNRDERGEGKGWEEGPSTVARESGKDGSLNSAALPLGGCSSARPEPEISEPVLQVSAWNGNGQWKGVDCF